LCKTTVFFIVYETIEKPMDILYYSNYCVHSKKIIAYLVKENLTNDLNCVCIDKRQRDAFTNQTYIFMEDGKRIMLPPNVHSVPALLLVQQNYRVVLGDEILPILHPLVKKHRDAAVAHSGGEPMAFSIGSNNSANVVSEKYTSYNLTPEELSAKGTGNNRQMANYVHADHSNFTIPTPPDNYRPDKIGSGVSLDDLQQKRNADISQFFPNTSPYIPSQSMALQK
jgi:hypothetical protein